MSHSLANCTRDSEGNFTTGENSFGGLIAFMGFRWTAFVIMFSFGGVLSALLLMLRWAS